MRVIDTHYHWFPPAHLERLSRRDGYPRTSRSGEGYVYWYNGGRGRIPLSPVWLDLEAGLARSRQATGDDTTVICTSGVLTGLLDQLPPTEAYDVATIYNEEMAAAQVQHPGQVLGTAVVPLIDANEALRVLDYAVKELNLRGINLPPITGAEGIDTSRLEDFYSRVEELEVPLIVHPTDIVFGETLVGYNDSFQLTIGRLLDSSMTILRLIFSGIMERHSGLRVVQTHGGALLPYQAGRFDKNSRIKDLPNPPSEYMKRLFVDTVCPQSLTIRTAVEFYGPAQVVYGTDYPCWSPAASIDTLQKSDLGEIVTNAILSTNAANLFPLESRSLPDSYRQTVVDVGRGV